MSNIIGDRAALKGYILRTLGSPIINIEVADEQVDDRIDDALQLFVERHYNGANRKYLELQITEQHKIDGFIVLPNEVLSVIHIHKRAKYAQMGEDVFMNDQWQAEAAAHRAIEYGGGLVNLEMTGQTLSALKTYTDRLAEYTYNKTNNKLFLLGTQPPVDEKILLETYTAIDSSDIIATDIFDDSFVKRYATSLVKKQWGQNLSKFDGSSTLPGGLTINGGNMLSEAKEEIESLMEELETRYTAPLNFFIG
jgi:hypothetical protein